VVFSAALAVGALFTPGESLIEALFGKPGTPTGWETMSPSVLRSVWLRSSSANATGW
jgi:hypothetical protein